MPSSEGIEEPVSTTGSWSRLRAFADATEGRIASSDASASATAIGAAVLEVCLTRESRKWISRRPLVPR